MTWQVLLLSIAAFIGHGFLCIAVVNRLFALPFGDAANRRIDRLRNLSIALFPIGLLSVWGLRGWSWPSVDAWREIPTLALAYFTLCVALAGSLPIAALWDALRRAPKQQISSRSMLVDIAAVLGHRPIGAEGSNRLWFALPGNEQFLLDLATREYRLPRLPTSWNGLTVLHLSDLHFDGAVTRDYFEKVIDLARDLSPDLIVFTGDLLDDSARLDWLETTLGRLQAPLGRFFVLGNHDWYVGADPIRAALGELGWTDVASRSVTRTYQGHPLLIAGNERPWMGTHPDLAASPDEAFRILLSHTPDNIRWARKERFDLMLAGHNHGGQIRLPLVGPVLSPSLYGRRYASGVFDEDPTLLLVSRGISGRHPYRWNCPPELSFLTLRSADSDQALGWNAAGDRRLIHAEAQARSAVAMTCPAQR